MFKLNHSRLQSHAVLLKKQAYARELKGRAPRAVLTSGNSAKLVEIATRHKEKDAEALGAVLDSANPDSAMGILSEHIQDSMSDSTLNYLLSLYVCPYFARKYLANHFYEPFSPTFHPPLFEMIRNVETGRAAKTSVLAGFRSSGKSAFGATLLPLRVATFDNLKLMPDGSVVDMTKRYIAFFGAIIDTATENMAPFVHELAYNELLHEDFGQVFFEEARTTTRRHVMTTNDRLFRAFSRYSKIRGRKYLHRRFQLCLLDDVEDDRSVKSAFKRKDDINWYAKTLNNATDEDNGHMLVMGNLIHPGCMIEKLADYGRESGIGWDVLVLKLYEVDEATGKKTYSWPERFNEEFETKKRAETGVIGLDAIDQEYLQNPLAGNKQLSFNDIQMDVQFVDIADRLEYMEIYTGVDPAIGETSDGDYFSIVSIAHDPVTKIDFVLPGSKEELMLSVGDQVAAVIEEHVEYDPVLIGIETVAYQAALKWNIDEMAVELGIEVRTTKITQNSAKNLRIKGLYPRLKSGGIRFVRQKDGKVDPVHLRCVQQLINIDKIDHDDVADALEMAIRTKSEEHMQRMIDSEREYGAAEAYASGVSY